MLSEPTELRIYYKRKKTLIDKYIDSLLAGDIKNLTIKEGYIMLEKLKAQREVYLNELETLKSTDIESLKLARLEEVKPEIFKQVEDEHQAKVDNVETKIKHYDFVISELEAATIAESDQADTSNDDQVEVF